jgi:hypothetical protein
MSGGLTYAGLKELAKELDRPLRTLEILHDDPFTAGRESRQAWAEWFSEIWHTFDIRPGTHLRRIHYKLVSQAAPIVMRNGRPYINSLTCFSQLGNAALDARYLGLVDANHLVDRRSPESILHHQNIIVDGEGEIERSSGFSCEGKFRAPVAYAGFGGEFEAPSFYLPKLMFEAPKFSQPCAIEVWIEKTSMNDVLVPVCRRYGVDFVPLAGEASFTYCVDLVSRARRRNVPTRVLVISDYDPAGQSIPVAIARKAEHRIYTEGLDVDLQIRHIALTAEQVAQYNLPRIPINDLRRSAAFEERHGEGGVELDALEALFPGTLRDIAIAEIKRYRDSALEEQVEKAEARAQAQAQARLDEIHRKVYERHADDIAALEAERDRRTALWKAADAELIEVRKEMLFAVMEIAARHQDHFDALAAELQSDFGALADPILRRMEDDLSAEMLGIEDLAEWPVAAPDDPHPDPLFDSRRDYLEQTDRYKRHQGKPTGRKEYVKVKSFSSSCWNCQKSFVAQRPGAKWCTDACRHVAIRARRRVQP